MLKECSHFEREVLKHIARYPDWQVMGDPRYLPYMNSNGGPSLNFQTIETLEQRGFIVCVRDLERRTAVVTLTPAGAEIAEPAHA